LPEEVVYLVARGGLVSICHRRWCIYSSKRRRCIYLPEKVAYIFPRGGLVAVCQGRHCRYLLEEASRALLLGSFSGQGRHCRYLLEEASRALLLGSFSGQGKHCRYLLEEGHLMVETSLQARKLLPRTFQLRPRALLRLGCLQGLVWFRSKEKREPRTRDALEPHAALKPRDTHELDPICVCVCVCVCVCARARARCRIETHARARVIAC